MSAVAHIDEYKTGRYFTEEFRGPMSWNGFEHNVLLRNMGTGEDGVPRFLDVSKAVGSGDIIDARGVALADYDNDGDLDIAINHNPGDTERDSVPAVLYRNDLGHRRSWLAVELVGAAGPDGSPRSAVQQDAPVTGDPPRASNRDAVGAVVRIESGGTRQLRVVTAGSGYSSQQTDRLSFGLGGADAVDTLTVEWPSGREQTFTGLAARQTIRVTEGVDEVEVVGPPGSPSPER